MFLSDNELSYGMFAVDDYTRAVADPEGGQAPLECLTLPEPRAYRVPKDERACNS